jgi:hypothetical protein
LCLYLRGEQISLDVAVDREYERIDYRCQTYADEGESQMIYELPDSVLAKLNVDELRSGISILLITGAATSHNPKDGYILEVDDDAAVNVVEDHHRRLTIRTQGTSSVLVVLVRSSDSVNSLSRNFVAGQIFNLSQPSFASQYEKCSAGKMNFRPAKYVNKTTGKNITNGVGEIKIEITVLKSEMTFNIENELLQSFEATFGSVDNFDHVLFCMPAGMSDSWIGYTYGQVFRSYYNDEWCGYYSLPFHEVSGSVQTK